jgi:hypothetical protein
MIVGGRCPKVSELIKCPFIIMHRLLPVLDRGKNVFVFRPANSAVEF